MNRHDNIIGNYVLWREHGFGKDMYKTQKRFNILFFLSIVGIRIIYKYEGIIKDI